MYACNVLQRPRANVYSSLLTVSQRNHVNLFVLLNDRVADREINCCDICTLRWEIITYTRGSLVAIRYELV